MTPLQKAAQAVIERWDSPAWKDQPHTANYIAELRKALDAELQQAVEPVAWYEHNPCLDAWFLAYSKNHNKNIKSRPLYLHPPQPQATTAVLRECWYESNELKVCRKCGQLHDKAIAAQGEKP